jgi:hypothetical protein
VHIGDDAQAQADERGTGHGVDGGSSAEVG